LKAFKFIISEEEYTMKREAKRDILEKLEILRKEDLSLHLLLSFRHAGYTCSNSKSTLLKKKKGIH